MKFNNPIELPSLKAKLKSVACLGEERGSQGWEAELVGWVRAFFLQIKKERECFCHKLCLERAADLIF